MSRQGRRSRTSVVVIGVETIEVEAPGFKRIRRGAASHYYWVVDEADGFKAYPTRTVRIHIEGLDRDTAVALIVEVCNREQQAMLAWVDEGATDRERLAPKYDGRVKSLVELYRSDPESGYQALKANTKEGYEDWLRIVETTIGLRRLDRIKPKFFRTCFAEWGAPADKGAPERPRRAYGCIQMVKTVLNYGIEADIPHAKRLRDGIEKMRFAKSAPRDKTMTYAQSSAIVDICLRKNNWRMALCQALQWDTMMRQKDVIGEYRLKSESYSLKPGEMRDGNYVWSGITLNRIDAGLELVVRTTKTGQPVLHVIDACELVMRVLPHIDRSDPTGPVALSSRGTPWNDHRAFSKSWRTFAGEAGVPPDVWNMDNRASGVSEAVDGGVADDDIASNAGHSDKKTTRDHYKRRAPQVSVRVQQKRRDARGRSSGGSC
jgi:integrase